MTTRAVVLGGGGVAGIGWLVGVATVLAQLQLREETAEISADFDMEDFLRLATTLAAEASSRLDAVRRFANMPRLDTSVSPAARREAVAARLPVKAWPDQRLSICVVAQDTGERAVIERSSGIDLVGAVTASCAVPGIWPPVELGGRLVLLEQQVEALQGERDQLAPGTSLVVQADQESVAAFGTNPLDPSTRAPAFHAGRRQAEQVLPDVSSFWQA